MPLGEICFWGDLGESRRCAGRFLKAWSFHILSLQYSWYILVTGEWYSGDMRISSLFQVNPDPELFFATCSATVLLLRLNSYIFWLCILIIGSCRYMFLYMWYIAIYWRLLLVDTTIIVYLWKGVCMLKSNSRSPCAAGEFMSKSSPKRRQWTRIKL